MNDLIAGEVLGKVVAHMHVIEFQKRGLPHAHILIILALLWLSYHQTLRTQQMMVEKQLSYIQKALT